MSRIETDSIILEGIPRTISKERMAMYLYNVMQTIGLTQLNEEESVRYREHVAEQFECGDLEVTVKAYTTTIFVNTPGRQVTGPRAVIGIDRWQQDINIIDANRYFLHQTLSIYVDNNGKDSGPYDRNKRATRINYQLIPSRFEMNIDKLRGQHIIYVIRGTCFGTPQSTSIGDQQRHAIGCSIYNVLPDLYKPYIHWYNQVEPMYHKIPGSNFEKPTFEIMLIIAADSDIPLEDIEKVKAMTWTSTNFQGVRDAIRYYGAGVERAESVGLYKRDISMHSICFEPLLTTRVQWFHNEVFIGDAIKALITDARIAPDNIECVYQIAHKESVGNVNEFKMMYRICVVWKTDKCKGKLPVLVCGRELRKLNTHTYRAFVNQTPEQADLPGREQFRVLSKNIVSWDKIATAKPTMITNQRYQNQELIGVLKGGSNQEAVVFSSEAQNKQRMRNDSIQETSSNVMTTGELTVVSDEVLTRKKREEDQLKQFNDRMQLQADMQRALQTRVDMLESVGQQSINLNAINHSAIVTSVSEYGQEMAKQLQQVQFSLRLLQGRTYAREPLTSAELDMVKYDYTKAGLPEPEYNANLFPEARYSEPTLRVMTLQPVDGIATVADGYRIEEPVVIVVPFLGHIPTHLLLEHYGL
jgi:hypothetical protein